MNELEAFVLAANKSKATATKIKQRATQIVVLAEKRGVDLGGPQGPGILRSIPDLALDPGQTQALGWMERFCEAKREPQRYAEEMALERSFAGWQDGNSTAPQTKSNRKNYLRQLLKVLRERGLPVPGRLDDVQNLEKEAGGVVSACKILGPLTQFFEAQASASAASALEPAGGTKRGRSEEGEDEPQSQLHPPVPVVAASCLGPRLTDDQALNHLPKRYHKDYKNSFFVGTKCRNVFEPFEEGHDTMAVGVACDKEGEPKLDDPPLIGFESKLLCDRGTEVLVTDAEGDLLFRHSLLVAYGSVRARAERLCVQLGVGDAAAAVNSFCGVGIDKTLSIAVYPSGMQKNGTSATLTAALSMVALLTGRRLKRLVASTGEMTLSGRVLEVGGLEEKTAVAAHYGVKVLICPRANLKDGLNLVNGVKLVGVDTLEEALETAFEWPAQDLAFLSGGNHDETKDEDRTKDAGTADRPPLQVLFMGTAQSMAHQLMDDGQVGSRVIQVDIMLYPGKGRVVAINYKTTIGKSDIEKAVGWLLNHMEKIPGCGSDRVLPDTSVNLQMMDILLRWDTNLELEDERYLASPCAVALLCAFRGYRHNPKAAILGALTNEGWLLKMALATELDVILLCSPQLEIIVVPQANMKFIDTICDAIPGIRRKFRFIGVKTLLEALPYVLLDYPSPAASK